jgi:DNA-binding NarL/FixJ family response regulator
MMRAKQVIEEQDAPQSIKRSAWVLYQHELERIDPATTKPFSSRRALANTLKWIALQAAKRKMKRLTPMQRQIIYLLAVEGLSQKQIANRLKRDRGTIKLRFAQIRQQFGMVSMYQVVALAVERGWIDGPKVDD